MDSKIKIGVSSCLLGEKVRWNGDHKQNHFVREILENYFEYISICPEMEVGMVFQEKQLLFTVTLKNQG